jgi:hypothetical protein
MPYALNPHVPFDTGLVKVALSCDGAPAPC